LAAGPVLADFRANVEAELEQRRYPRQRVSWLVTLAAGSRQYQGRTKDISASGAKILLKERPPLGTEVALSFRPPGVRPVETRGLVWRLDTEGVACMFVGTQTAEFLEAVTPRKSSTAPPPSKPKPAAPPAGTVLVAVADVGVRTLVLEALGRSGHAVLDAGPQPLLALRIAEQHHSAIALVLVTADLRLMNGEPLAGRLSLVLPEAKVVLMSSGSSPSPGGAGALWLRTPCTDADLMTRVREALAR